MAAPFKSREDARACRRARRCRETEIDGATSARLERTRRSVSVYATGAAKGGTARAIPPGTSFRGRGVRLLFLGAKQRRIVVIAEKIRQGLAFFRLDDWRVGRHR